MAKRGEFRKAHILTPLKGCEMGRKVVFFDSESRLDEQLNHHPYLICATFARYDLKNPYQDRVYLKENKNLNFYPNLSNFYFELDNYVKKGESVTVYSHNCFYDLVVTQGITALTAMGYRVMSFFEKGLTFFLKMQLIEKEKIIKTLDFVSTTNYFSTSLNKLAKTFGFPDKLEFDYNNGSIEDAIIYCKRDVEIIKLAMESFREMVKDEDFGTLKPTIAGQAYAAYRHSFMNAEIFIHNNDKATEIEREGYYGGRVECFRIGTYTGEFYKTDVNSMYPYVMRNFTYPIKLASYRKKGTIRNLRQLIKNGFGVIARVKLKTDKPNLPYRSKEKLIFPIGEFIATLPTPELEYCLKFNLITEVYENSIYYMDYIFKDYIDYFYHKRLQAKAAGDDVRTNMYKLFLNSLYGKFGQKSESWERIGDERPDKVQVLVVKNTDGTKDIYKIFGGSIFKRIEEKESFNSFCAIAAHVTSYARMLLTSYLETASRKNVFYCDTDSIFTNSAGYKNLLNAGFIDDKELGKLKLEETGTELEIYAPKDYSFNHHIKIKGVKKDKDGNIPEPKRIEEGKLVFECIQWHRLNGMLQKGIIDSYQNVVTEKKLNRVYNGGVIDNTGIVHPFIIDNEQILK